METGGGLPGVCGAGGCPHSGVQQLLLGEQLRNRPQQGAAPYPSTLPCLLLQPASSSPYFSSPPTRGARIVGQTYSASW